MPGRISLVVIHGMGAQQTDFANALMADVLSCVGADGNRVVWKPIYWARVLEPRESALWTAMTSARDPAEGALLTARQRGTVDRIEDHEINAGGLVTSWNPASHNDYWTDSDFTKPVAEYLSALLRAV